MRTSLTVVMVFLLAACEKHPWEALVYPKTGTMPYDLALGHYATLDECRAAAKAVIAKTIPEEGASPSYECGRNCTVSDIPPPPGMLATRTCEETAK